ncbi:MAG TPA: helix-turn-helix transcriptional regulator [Terracidiphilus sp.]|nr:helix-turn-helix transcriptional regulator [Terracidiphilus sp.]
MAQRKICSRHGVDYPCSCGMGNLYRFVEPVVLQLLQQKGRSCGYQLCSDLQEHALTDAEIDKAALYRTLRQLERNGNVKSTWETGDGGPARRVYRLTRAGEVHLEEWTNVLENMAKSMTRFVDNARQRQPRTTGKKRAVSNG